MDNTQGLTFIADVGKYKDAEISGVDELLRLINGGARFGKIRRSDAPPDDPMWVEPMTENDMSAAAEGAEGLEVMLRAIISQNVTIGSYPDTFKIAQQAYKLGLKSAAPHRQQAVVEMRALREALSAEDDYWAASRALAAALPRLREGARIAFETADARRTAARAALERNQGGSQ